MMFRVPLARRRRAVGLLALLLALAVVGGAARGSIADPTPSPSTSRSVQVPYYDNALSRKAFEYRDRHLLYDAAANVAVAVVDITGLEFDPSDVPVESPVDTEILEGDDVTFMKYLHPELYDAIKPGKDVRKLLIVTTANVPRKRPPAKAGKKKDKKGTAGEEEDPGIHSEELILDFLKKKKIDA